MVITFTKREIKIFTWIARQMFQVMLLLVTFAVPLRIMFKGFTDTAEWYRSTLDTAAWLFWCSHEEIVWVTNQMAKNFGLDYVYKIEGD